MFGLYTGDVSRFWKVRVTETREAVDISMEINEPDANTNLANMYADYRAKITDALFSIIRPTLMMMLKIPRRENFY